MYKLILFLLILSVNIKASATEPKLVVGIVVDQMRYDYVDRFWGNFKNNGFKKLINNGYFLKNTHFSYVPTYTGPGHASIFTGTTPSNHGIIANNWYDKNIKKSVYCAGNGEMHTICNCGDEMQLFNPSSKVIGISLKDRGAILSAGHSADAAYWMDKHGDWISSSFYMDELPVWLIEHQNKNSVAQYLVGKWKYKNSFSHNLDSLLMTNGGGIIKSTPLGNTILADLALQVLKNEKLGQSKTTDFLSISFSSTDYIGHQYGPHSDEIVDTYIKLDNEIGKILDYIEQEIGFDNVVIFLTADHGVVSEPHKLQELNIPSGYYSNQEMKDELTTHLRDHFNWPVNNILAKEFILNYSNNQVFLNHDFIKENIDVPMKDIQEICAEFLLKNECVKNTYTAYQMHNYEYTHSQHAKIQRGFNRKRSGDVIVDIQPGWISKSYEKGGTTHGSSYNYDTHVPLVFFGGNIKKGKTDRFVNIKDIAPTISSLLGISFPNGCTGNPIMEITK
jgi:predicted AlkP superfamily pyrophosphatase or phosphodiesterase